MKLLFTKSNLIGSKLIRWGLDESCSHVAIKFRDGTVLHSSFSGVHEQSYLDFDKLNDIVYSLKDMNTLQRWEENSIKEELLNRYIGKSYDFLAFIYFSWRVILKKLLRIPFPKTNAWNKPNSFLCTEFVGVLTGEDNSMISPESLYKKLVATQGWEAR